MNKKIIATAGLLFVCLTFAQAQSTTSVEIRKDVTRLIPISISGFSGEAASVINFDLEVLGMKSVGPAEAEYLISGSNNGGVEGKLTDANKTVLFSRGYQGASTRALAHAFAEDVVKVVRPGLKGIFNTKVAFRVEQGSAMEIGVSDFDGYNSITVTHDNSLVNGPCWMPGKRTLFYASWKNGPTQILEHDLNSGERKPFAKYPGANYAPAVSPDGRHVAMVLNKGGSPDLYVCDIDGTNLRQLTRTREEESSPCWSPDGRQICYVVRRGRAALYKISVNGGAETKLATRGAYGTITEPDWSPDGKTIVFTSMTGSFNIYSVPAEGGDVTPLVGGEDPCWAPNSRTVVFTRRESGKRVLSLLDVPTKHVKDVPEKVPGSCSQPSWAR